MSRRRLVYSFLSVVFVLFLSSPVFGAGFALYEGSARGNVLGAGLVASADDASALFYNPAGITQLKGTQLQIGVTAITPIYSVDISSGPAPGAGEYKSQTNWFFPPHFYLTYQINDKWYVGVGEFSRYGLGTEFQNGWPGRYNSYRASIQEFEINPNVAYKVNDKFSIAAGLVGSYFNVSLSRALSMAPSPLPDADFNVSGDSWGWGWDIALQYKPFDWMQFGITYRSKIEQNVKGNVAVNSVNPPLYAAGANIKNMSGSADITLPDTIYTGLNFNITKTWSVGGGVYWTGWQYYDKLQINFGAPFGPTDVTTAVSPKNWANVARYMIGTEWKVTPEWDLRLGYAYDVAPEPNNTLDYILPDNDRQMFSIGAGYHRAAYSVDLSYTYMVIIDNSYMGQAAGGPAGTFPGKLTSGTAHLIGLTFGYKF